MSTKVSVGVLLKSREPSEDVNSITYSISGQAHTVSIGLLHVWNIHNSRYSPPKKQSSDLKFGSRDTETRG